jgi:hypothetical protein
METEPAHRWWEILFLCDEYQSFTTVGESDNEEELKLSYSLSENDQDARVSVLTGRATAHKATISTSKSQNLQRDWFFESKIFSELKKTQNPSCSPMIGSTRCRHRIDT